MTQTPQAATEASSQVLSQDAKDQGAWTARLLVCRCGRAKAPMRSGYIAIYEVDGVEFDDNGLRFRFTRRVADLV